MVTADGKVGGFNKPIIIEGSIYTEAQTFDDIGPLERWATNSFQRLDDKAGMVRPYFDNNELDSFSRPFADIMEIIQNYRGAEKTSARDLSRLRNKVDKILQKTLAKGLTFASPSDIDTVSYQAGRQTNYYAGFYSKLFNLSWILPVNNFANVNSNSFFQRGITAASYFDKLHNGDKSSPERSLETILGTGEAKFEARLEAADEQLKKIEQMQNQAIALRDELDKSIPEQIAKSNKILSGTFFNFEEGFKAKLANVEAAMIKLITGHEGKMKGIEDAFSEQISLSEPAEYWEKRAKNSRYAAIGFGVVFVIVSLFFVWIAFNQGPELYGKMITESGDKGLSLAAVAVFTFPVIVGLWMLKSAARLFVENLHFHQDASYRKMMILTYLSMLQDPINPITPEEREHALKAIFSSSPGQAQPITLPTDRSFTRG